MKRNEENVMTDDPCDDWHPSFSYSIGRLFRHATGINHNPQFDLCDDCQHWVTP